MSFPFCCVELTLEIVTLKTYFIFLVKLLITLENWCGNNQSINSYNFLKQNCKGLLLFCSVYKFAIYIQHIIVEKNRKIVSIINLTFSYFLPPNPN